MTILDTTIVNVALATLGRELGASVTAVSWVTTGYLLALATVIPLTGWAADRFGGKRTFIAALVFFVAGSALSAAAWSAGALVAFRMVQGLGGGMVLPVGMTMLTRAAGAERVGRTMGIVFVPMLLGPVLGPVIGGWLVDGASWRGVFLLNVPPGGVAPGPPARPPPPPRGPPRGPPHRPRVLPRPPTAGPRGPASTSAGCSSARPASRSSSSAWPSARRRRSRLARPCSWRSSDTPAARPPRSSTCGSSPVAPWPDRRAPWCSSAP